MKFYSATLLLFSPASAIFCQSELYTDTFVCEDGKPVEASGCCASTGACPTSCMSFGTSFQNGQKQCSCSKCNYGMKLSLTTDERYLKATNYFRCLHGQPMLTWNPTMASQAQTWANTCPSQGGNPPHSDSYSLNPSSGQNVAAGQQKPEDAVEDWYSEVNTPGYVAGTTGSGAGHYTALIWKATTNLGCAQASCTSGSPKPVHVCHYANAAPNIQPASNYIANVPQTNAPTQSTATCCSSVYSPPTTTVAITTTVVATTAAAVTTTVAATTAPAATTPTATAAATTAAATTTAQAATTPTATAAATTAAATTTAQVATTAAATVAATTTAAVATTAAPVTNLQVLAVKGSNTLVVQKQDLFTIGQTITIDPGLSIEEIATITGFASLLLKNPLKYNHAVNAVVQASVTTTQAVTTTTPGVTQTATPVVVKDAANDVPQQVSGVANPLLLMFGLFVSAAIVAIAYRATKRKPRLSREFQSLSVETDSESPFVE